MLIAELSAEGNVVPDVPLLAPNSIEDRLDAAIRGLPNAVVFNGRSCGASPKSTPSQVKQWMIALWPGPDVELG